MSVASAHTQAGHHYTLNVVSDPFGCAFGPLPVNFMPVPGAFVDLG